MALLQGHSIVFRSLIVLYTASFVSRISRLIVVAIGCTFQRYEQLQCIMYFFFSIVRLRRPWTQPTFGDEVYNQVFLYICAFDSCIFRIRYLWINIEPFEFLISLCRKYYESKKGHKDPKFSPSFLNLSCGMTSNKHEQLDP